MENIHIDYQMARQQLSALTDTRKSFLNLIGQICDSYNQIPLGAWDGKTRIEFHKKFFGNASIILSTKNGSFDAYVLQLIQKCDDLNEKLWEAAVYCSTQSETLSTDYFLNSVVQVNKASLQISVTQDQFSTNFENLDGWKIHNFLLNLESIIDQMSQKVYEMENSCSMLKKSIMYNDTYFLNIISSIDRLSENFSQLKNYFKNGLENLRKDVDRKKKNQDPSVIAKYY